MKKIIIIRMKKKKILVQKPFLGYCLNYIVKKKNLYCNIEIVLQETGEKVVGLYCKEGLK